MWRVLAVALFVAVGVVALATPAYAAASSSSTTVSIAMQNGSTFAYGSNVTPSFTVVVTFTTPPPSTFPTVHVVVDGSQTQPYGNANAPTESADHLTETFRVDSNDAQIAVGSHTAQAEYLETQTNSWIPSNNTVTFSITKGTPTLHCVIQSGGITISPGEMLQIETDATAEKTSVPVSGTFSIRFIGPTTVTTTGLQPDSNHLVTVSAPPQIGNYTNVWCIFEGNASFNSVSTNISGQQVLVSEKRQMGGASLYTNPTTLMAYQPADAYIVLHAGAGLPTPTGYCHINLGTSSTNAFALGPNGDVLVHLDRLPSLAGASQIDVVFQGDPYYDAATFHFPLTNPPIPGGASGNSGGGAQGKATATASATGTPRASATATAGDGAVSTAAVGSSAGLAAQPGSGGMLWLWVALGVLVLGGGGAAGAVYVVRRSRRAGASALGESVLDGERPRAGIGGHLDGVDRFGSGGSWGNGEW